MADRQTMNVSLPEAQEQFVRDQVASGRYRSASEVLRDGLRLLEQAEHRRLLQKYIVEGLSDEELSKVPPELFQRLKEHVGKLLADAAKGEVIDGPTAMEEIRKKLEARRPRKSA
jgi:antitoxin ParD1/3/4